MSGSIHAYTQLHFMDGSFGALQDNFSSPMTSGIKTVSVSATAPANTQWVTASIYVANAGTADVNVDNILWCACSSTTPYFDGDSPGASWSASRGQSTSTGYAWTAW